MSPTGIEWTQATWNPIVGCSVVSPGCTNCYAMKMAGRLEAMSQSHEAHHGGDPGPLAHYRGTTRAGRAGAVWTGKTSLAPLTTILEPLRRRKPTMYFVNSMSDLFHEDVPDGWIDIIFAVMALAPQHTFQVLTKRADRMRAYVGDWSRQLGRQAEIRAAIIDLAGGRDAPGVTDAWNRVSSARGKWHPLPNVWLGVSVEDQERAAERVPDLLATPAAIRWVSSEPLLGPIDFTRLKLTGIIDPFDALCGSTWTTLPNGRKFYAWSKGPGLDWIVVGGESGPKARPMHPDWARSIRDQCKTAEVPFFFKQFGEWGMPTDSLGKLDWPYHPDYDRTHWFDSRICARPIEQGWSDKYHGGGGALPPGFDLWSTPEYLDQVARCPQESCRDAGQCQGNEARAAVTRVGKKAAGRILDGVEHNAFPETAHA